MQLFEEVLPSWGQLADLQEVENLRPFGDLQFEFAAELSHELMLPARSRLYPELAALGFWLRPGHVRALLQAQVNKMNDSMYVPRGLVFHIAPSNVDTIFVYSWLISMLCGNRNVIRISSRISAQTEVLLAILKELLEAPEWAEIAKRVLVVRYGREGDLTARLSQVCDVRVVWGGDSTINSIRTLALQPHATELTFANKFSLCIIDADSVNQCNETSLCRLTRAFYNDAYWFGQMACSSPRLVLWRGAPDSIKKARVAFWNMLEIDIRDQAPDLTAADYMNKEVEADALAINENVDIVRKDNRLTRIWLHKLAVHINAHCGAGLFHEAAIECLDEICPILNRHIQTVSYFGLEKTEIENFVNTYVPAGIDRFVKVGHALDFGTIWDGYDLFSSFLRKISWK